MMPETAQQPLEGSARQAAVGSLKLVLFYAAFAGLWILLSDWTVEWLFGSPAHRALAQTLKGLLFVAVTSVLVYVLMRRLAGRVRDAARREAAAQTEKLRALQLLESIANSSSDAIFAKDIDDRFVVFNRAAERLTGKGAEDVLGRDEMAVFPPELARRLIADNHRVMTEDRVIMFQEDLVTAQGKRTFLTTKGPMHDAGGKVIGMFGSARDISELKLAEDALRHANRALRTLRACHEVLVRATSEEQLLRDICRRLVDLGGYVMAWAGYAEEDADRTVRPVAEAGFERGYLDMARISWADNEHGRGPTGTAIREHRPVMARNIQTDPAFAPWREAALQRGYASSIALPLLADAGHCLGALNIYAGEAKAFDDNEVHLLAELANDLVYGIRVLRDRAARDVAEDALRESATRLRAIVESSPVALAVNDEHQNITLVSPKFVETFGYTLADIPNLAAWWPLAYPDPAYRQRVAQEWQAAAHKAQQDGTELEPMEYAVTCKDGSVRDIRFSMAPMGGSSLVILYDITERKKTEQKILAQLDELLRWQRLTIGREERMLQLKAEVNELLARQGEPARYPGQAD